MHLPYKNNTQLLTIVHSNEVVSLRAILAGGGGNSDST